MIQKRLRPPVNVTLSLEARAMLENLAEARGLSRSATVETLIRSAEAKHAAHMERTRLRGEARSAERMKR